MPADRCIEQLLLRGNDIVVRAGRVDGVCIGSLVRVGDVLISAVSAHSLRVDGANASE